MLVGEGAHFLWGFHLPHLVAYPSLALLETFAAAVGAAPLVAPNHQVVAVAAASAVVPGCFEVAASAEEVDYLACPIH